MYGENNSISVRIPYPSKSATVRLPSNDEVTAYLDRASKKGRKEDDYTPDVELFKSLRLDKDGEAFDAYECSYVVNNLLNQKITVCERSGDEYSITIKTPFGEAVHTLRPPTLKEMVQYRRGLVSSDAKASRNASVKLYDALQQSAEGYADGIEIPVLHKVAVVSEIYLSHSQIDPIQIDPLD